MEALTKGNAPGQFEIQILPRLSVEKCGLLKRILCVHPGTILLAAFFEAPEGKYRVLQKPTEPVTAVKWLQGLLAGGPDFSG